MQTWPDRTFHNFRASWSGDPRILCCSKTPIHRLWGTKTVKCSFGSNKKTICSCFFLYFWVMLPTGSTDTFFQAPPRHNKFELYNSCSSPTPRQTLSQFLSFRIRRKTFLNDIKFADLEALNVWSAWKHLPDWIIHSFRATQFWNIRQERWEREWKYMSMSVSFLFFFYLVCLCVSCGILCCPNNA